MNWGGFALAIGALTSLFSGVMGMQAGRREAKDHERQGQIAQQEANTKAAQLEKDNRLKRRRLAMSYVKSGVQLRLSALDRIDAQYELDTAEEESYRQQGSARVAFSKIKSKAAKEKGLGGLIGSLGRTFGYGAESYESFRT